MTTKAERIVTTESQTDVVREARELLRRASFEGYSVFPWALADDDCEVVDATGQVLLKVWNGYHNGELAAAAPELITRLCDELEQLRERFSVTRGNCEDRYLGPKDELLHGYNVCNMSRCED